MSLAKHVLLTFLWVGSSIAIAIEIDDLGVVVDFVGSTSGVIGMFVFPGYILMAPNGPYSEPCRWAGL
jgi:hypothetical protein